MRIYLVLPLTRDYPLCVRHRSTLPAADTDEAARRRLAPEGSGAAGRQQQLRRGLDIFAGVKHDVITNSHGASVATLSLQHNPN